ncbi:gluconolactonase [Blastomyces parvus]|uniref:Gluconolactonase n=1 Tax=Blastomyces parvus TaxID=2060905 RepID=A0A2B7WQH3_9EURO|nr:gluconolactonase [Blastomyces parvus]
MAERHPPPITTVTKVTFFDTKRAATDIPYSRSFSSSSFVVYSEKFIQDVIGDNPQLSLVSSRKDTKDQFAHEAGVYIRSTNSIYFTSNYQTSDPRIDLYAITADTWQIEKLTSKPGFDTVSQPNGACNYQDKVLYCAQGDIHRGKNGGGISSQPSALTLVDPVSGTAETLLNNFYGREFSSLNDVVVHHGTGDIWFTDPTYGYEQAFRPPPVLPKQVYRFRPSTGQCWAAANGFEMCNGLCFNPDYTLMYITDTGSIQSHGDIRDGHNFSVRATLPASIYVYDVVDGGTRLANRRLFAFCDNGVPDGIKCDEKGYVYSGCGDGVHVWDTEGSLVGKIVVGGTTANFCFDEKGIWMFAEEELWFCKLKARGALLDVNWNE